jgi:hypothetical protein
MCHDSGDISAAYIINISISNTNAVASQFEEVITLIFPEVPVIPTLQPPKLYCFCGLVDRVSGYRSTGPGSIPGVSRFSEK